MLTAIVTYCVICMVVSAIWMMGNWEKVYKEFASSPDLVYKYDIFMVVVVFLVVTSCVWIPVILCNLKIQKRSPEKEV